MTMSAQKIVERIAITWTEGRLENVLERQKQLAALHQSLHRRFDDCARALQQDLDSPARLAKSEVTAALDAINSLYTQLNFSDVLAKERNLKKGANAARFLVPLGSTLVVQLPSSPIISTLGPLAAALAAGSPTIVLGAPSLPATSNMLGCIILEALDREAFHFEQSADVSTCEAFAQAEYATVVLHSLDTSDRIRPLVLTTNPAVRIIEPYYGIPAGIIDRSVADAIDVVTKRIRLAVQDVPKGNSSRVPRLFFVDESIFTSFKNGMQAQREVASINLDEWLRKQYRGISPRYCTDQSRKQRIPELPVVQGAIILTFSSNSEIVLIPTRSSDHTIDLLNKINASTGSQVIYIFAGGKEGFYLGNFITTSYVYLNDVPVDSLVLTSCRSANATATQGYYFEDFSEMKVMLQVKASTSQSKESSPAKLNASRVKQFSGGRMSYFEQGLILGAAIGIAALVSAGYVSYRVASTFFVR